MRTETSIIHVHGPMSSVLNTIRVWTAARTAAQSDDLLCVSSRSPPRWPSRVSKGAVHGPESAGDSCIETPAAFLQRGYGLAVILACSAFGSCPTLHARPVVFFLGQHPHVQYTSVRPGSEHGRFWPPEPSAQEADGLGPCSRLRLSTSALRGDRTADPHSAWPRLP
jgi:hypothetical protein